MHEPTPLSKLEADQYAELVCPPGQRVLRVTRDGDHWVAVFQTGPDVTIEDPDADNRVVRPIRNETLGPIKKP